MPEVIGVVHAVAGQIPVPFVLQQLGPEGSHVGQRDTGPAQGGQGIAVLREQRLVESRPVPVYRDFHRLSQTLVPVQISTHFPGTGAG